MDSGNAAAGFDGAVFCVQLSVGLPKLQMLL